MSLTQYYTATTLDGFIADPNNSLDWLFTRNRDKDGPGNYDEFIADVGALAMGSTTYEWILDHEFKDKAPSEWKWPYEIPSWVFTHRELAVVPDASIEFVSGDVVSVHGKMVEAASGHNVWIVGGGDLVGQFADAGLLDEVIVQIAPVTLGAGARSCRAGSSCGSTRWAVTVTSSAPGSESCGPPPRRSSVYSRWSRTSAPPRFGRGCSCEQQVRLVASEIDVCQYAPVSDRGRRPGLEVFAESARVS